MTFRHIGFMRSVVYPSAKLIRFSERHDNTKKTPTISSPFLIIEIESLTTQF